MNTETIQPEGGSGYEKLKAQQSLEDILATAMSFEEIARDFYAELTGKVSKPLRGLVEELAEEEARHYQLFKDIREREDIQSYVDQQIATPASDHRFSDYIQSPDLGESPDDQSVLRYALGREQAAMEQYAALADEVPAGPVADLFRMLANEELEHKRELEKLYYELIHSGGV